MCSAYVHINAYLFFSWKVCKEMCLLFCHEKEKNFSELLGNELIMWYKQDTPGMLSTYSMFGFT